MKNYQNYTMDDIIFEGRNKQYGAYQLRSLADRHTTIGLLAAVSMFALLLIIGNFDLLGRKQDKPLIALSYQFTDISLPVEIVKPEPVKRSAPPPKSNTIENTELKVVENTAATSPEKQEELVKYTASTETHIDKTITNSSPLISEKEVMEAATVAVVDKAEIPDKPRAYSEIMPMFPGGKEALMEYLKNKIRPSEVDMQKELVGKLVIRFYIDVDGTVRSPEVLKDNAGGHCAQAALAAINKMPKWTPGRQGDKPVKVYYVLPVTFDYSR